MQKGMEHVETAKVDRKPIDPTIHEKLVAARAARSIVVTDDMPREEIPSELLAIDYERWDGLA